MSTTIDERVVEMRFDNQNFEKNVQTSMSTLEKLKKSLKLSGASKGLENIGSAAQKVNLNGISSAAEVVQARFSALQVVGMTALSNITSAAMRAGENLARSFTIEPITTGFNEFELKMGSVQTIMASTGASLETVNQYLDELNEYSDRTIYSFSDMTSNIGKFTNAGVKLEDAVMAIKGISNEAAVSGANANEASRAMYNFAQALSAGYVKLIDWKSIENANMATVEFKTQLLEAGVAAGTLSKNADGMYQVLTTNGQGSSMDGVISATSNFNDSLNYQWMTTEVLVNTLKDYADETTDIGKKAYSAAQDVKTFSMMMDTLREAAQSGWAQTWELIVGDFEEGKTLWTELSEVFGEMIDKSADARNSLLGGALKSNWEKILDQVTEAGIPVDEFQEKIKETAREHNIAIDEMIEKEGSLAKVMTSGQIDGNIVREAIRGLTGSLKESSTATEVTTGKWSELQEIVAKVVRGDYGDTWEERAAALTEAGYDYAEVQELVNKTWEEMGHQWGTFEEVQEACGKAIGQNVEEIVKLSDEELKNQGYTEEEIQTLRDLQEQAEQTGTPLNELIDNLSAPSGRSLLIDSLMNSIQAVIKVIGLFKSSWKDIFGEVDSGRIYGMIEAFHSLTEDGLAGITENADKIARAFKGVFSIIDMTISLISGGFKMAFNGVKSVLEWLDIDILEIIASIGDALVAWRDWFESSGALEEGLAEIPNVLKSGIAWIRNWINQFKEIPEIKEKLDALSSVIDNLIKSFSERFPNVAKFITDFITSIKEMAGVNDEIGESGSIKTFAENFIKYISDVGARVQDFKSLLSNMKAGITGFFEGVSNFIKGILEKDRKEVSDLITEPLKTKAASFNLFSSEGLLGSFYEQVSAFLENIKTRISEFDFGDLLVAGFAGGMAFALKKLYDLLAVPVKLLEKVTKGIGGVEKTLGGVTKVFKAYARDKSANAFLKLAGAIAIFAGSLALLTLVDQDKLRSSAVTLGVFSASLMGLTAVLGKVDGFSEGAKGVQALGIGIALLAASLKLLETLDPEKISRDLVILGVLMGGLTIAAGVIGKFSPKSAKGAASIVAFAASLLIVVKALKNLSKLSFDPGNLLIGIGALTVIMTELMLLAAICKSRKNSSMSGSAASILAMVVSLKILVDVIKSISKIKMDNVYSNLDAFILVFGMFAALVIAGKALNNSSGSLAKTGAGLLAMSASLVVLAQAVKMLSRIDGGSLTKGVAAIGVLSAFVAGLIAVTKLAGENGLKAGASMLIISGAIAILAGIVIVLGQLDPSKVITGTAAISALMLCMGVMIGLTRLSGKVNPGSLIILTSVVAALGALLAVLSSVLSDVPSGSLVEIAESITLLVTALTTSLIALSKLNKGGGPSAGSIAGMLAVMTGLAAIIGVLSYLKVDNTLDAALSLSAMILALSAALKIASTAGDVSTKALAAIGVMTLVMAALSVMIGILGSLPNLGPTLEIATSLSEMILALAAAVSMIGAVSKLISGSGMLAGILGMVGVIAAFGAVMTALAGLNELTKGGLESFLNEGLPLLSKIGEGIGSFVGSIFSGFGSASNSLPNVGANLSDFATNAQPFFTFVNSFGMRGFSAIQSLTSSMLAITKADFIDAITFWDEQSGFESFGENVGHLADGLNDFATKAGGIKAANLSGAVSVTESLVEISGKIPSVGGLKQILLGWKDFDYFGDGISNYGDGLKTFCTAVGGIEATNMSGAISVSEDLAVIANKIPSTGGALQNLVGWKDFSAFGEGIKKYGESLTAFNDSVGELDANDVSGALTITDNLVTMADKIPPTGGVLQNIVGWANYADFGEGIKKYGRALKKFNNSVGGLDAGNLEGALTATETLVACASALPETGGLFSFFSGDTQTFEEFGVSVEAFGNSLKTYATSVSDIKAEDLTAAQAEIQTLIDLANDSAFDTSLGTLSTKLTDFATDAGSISNFLVGFGTNLATIDHDSIEKGLKETKKLLTLMQTLTTMTPMTTSDNQSDNSGAFTESLVSSFLGAIENAEPEITSAIEGLISTVKASIVEQQDTISDAFGTLITTAVESMSSAKASGTGDSPFASLTAGFAESITSASGDVEDAAESLVSTFNQTISNANITTTISGIMDAFIGVIRDKASGAASIFSQAMSSAAGTVRSYYGTFYSTGAYIADGLAAGIRANAYKAANAAAAMARATASASSSAVQVKSPSRVFYKIGDFCVMGFANALKAGVSTARKAGSNLADSARSGLAGAISKISKNVPDELNMEPTIRPVLDLSEIEAGANEIGGLLQPGYSVALAADTDRSIAMARSSYGSGNEDVVSAIDRLEKAMSTRTGDVYNVNGVTYDDGSNVSSAVRSLIRAARVERRS